MASSLTFKLNGAEGLIAALAELEDRVAKKVARHATREAMKPVLAAAKELCPVSDSYSDAERHGNPPGFLRDSLVVRSVKSSKKHAIGAQVTSRDGLFKGDEYYGGMVEFGTSKMAAKPFLRPALDQNQQTVVDVLAREIAAGIDKQHATEEDS